MNSVSPGTLMVADNEKWLYMRRGVKSCVSRELSYVIMIDTWQSFLPLPPDLNK